MSRKSLIGLQCSRKKNNLEPMSRALKKCEPELCMTIKRAMDKFNQNQIHSFLYFLLKVGALIF